VVLPFCIETRFNKFGVLCAAGASLAAFPFAVLLGWLAWSGLL